MSVNVPDHVAGSGKWEEWWVALAGVHEDMARSTGGADVESVRRVVGVVDDAMFLIEKTCEGIVDDPDSPGVAWDGNANDSV